MQRSGITRSPPAAPTCHAARSPLKVPSILPGRQAVAYVSLCFAHLQRLFFSNCSLEVLLDFDGQGSALNASASHDVPLPVMPWAFDDAAADLRKREIFAGVRTETL